MKAYRYSPAEIGLSGWPDGELQLTGAVRVTDPKEAEIFMCPGPLLLFNEPSDMNRFPYMAGNEERHVFFDVSENSTVFGRNCIFIRTNLKKHMLAGDPNSVSFPWPVENYAECVDVPEGGFKYDVSFHGWVIYATRRDVTEIVQKTGELKSDMACYPDFTGAIYSTPEGIRRRGEFRRSMRESRLCLCPESIPGDFPYRFFEAMSAGRVPVLVGRNQVFPFADEIPYADFSIHIDLDEVRQAGRILTKFLQDNDDAELIRKGKLARQYWLKYLNREDWHTTMMYAAKKIWYRLGLIPEAPVL